MTGAGFNEMQRRKMSQFMDAHHGLARNLTNCANGKMQHDSWWKELVTSLNALGPPTKAETAWRKSWTDRKQKVKKILVHNKREREKTGAGSPQFKKLDEYDEMVSRAAGLEVIVNGIEAQSFDGVPISTSCGGSGSSGGASGGASALPVGSVINLDDYDEEMIDLDLDNKGSTSQVFEDVKTKKNDMELESKGETTSRDIEIIPDKAVKAKKKKKTPKAQSNDTPPLIPDASPDTNAQRAQYIVSQEKFHERITNSLANLELLLDQLVTEMRRHNDLKEAELQYLEKKFGNLKI